MQQIASVYQRHMIFASSMIPGLLREDFDENPPQLRTLERIFDGAKVFRLRGESFRGKKLETVSRHAGKVKAAQPMHDSVKA